MEFKILDLFCGGGGFSFGFIPYSTKHLAIDIDPFSLATFSQNNPTAKIIRADIRSLHSSTIEQLLGGPPDIIIASPPCEEFSFANPISNSPAIERIYETGSARLLLEAIRIIGDLNPSVFVIENVAALLSSGGKEIIFSELNRVGVNNIKFNFIRAEQHGNPSKRLRLFISNISLKLPRKRPPTVMETIGDLPPLGIAAIFDPREPPPNHELRILSRKMEKAIQKTTWGQGVKYFRSKRRIMPNWVRLHPNRVSTSVNGLTRYIHPFENRLLSVREHARLMSYPDDYIFVGPIDSQYNQVGESVPPLISSLIAEEVISKIAA